MTFRQARAVAERQLAVQYYGGPAAFGRHEAGLERWIALRGRLHAELAFRGECPSPEQFEQLVGRQAAREVSS